MFFICQVSRLVENFNFGIYLDTKSLCQMSDFHTTHRALPFLPLSVVLTIFQGHSNAKKFSLKILCFKPIKWKLCRNVNQVDKEYTTIFHFLHVFKGDNWLVSWFEKKNAQKTHKKPFYVSFLADTLEAGLSNLA